MSLIAPLAGCSDLKKTDFKLCIICQKESGPLVLNPRQSSYVKFMEWVKKWVDIKDNEYVSLHQRLEGCTPETLKRDKAVWHRICYSNVTHTEHFERAKDQYEFSSASG